MSIDALAYALKWYHGGLTLDDIELSDVPGYWTIKKPCGGRGVCQHPLHGFIFNEGPINHTIQFLDPRRDERGRWASPYQTWKAMAS